MKENDALALLDRLLLTDKWGKKLIDAAARREIIECLGSVPDKDMIKVHEALFPPGRLEALVGVLAKHPEPPLLKLVLAGYKRFAERPGPKVRARLDKIKALAGELAKSRHDARRRALRAGWRRGQERGIV